VTGLTSLLVSPEDADPQTLKRSNEVLNRLVQVSLILDSMLDMDELLQFVLEVAVEVTDAQVASILLLDENTQQFQVVASTGSGKPQAIPVPLEGTTAGIALKENRPVFTSPAEDAASVLTQVTVPMRLRGEVVGVLEAYEKDADAGPFDDEDARRLTILAGQAAGAIDNARRVEALQQAYDDLDTLDRLKSDFISVASHELRTPLSVILGYATFLKEDSEGQASDLAGRVINSAMKMRALIEDMVNLTQVKGDADLDIQLVTVNSVMRAAQQDIAGLAEAKGQALIVDVPVEQVEINTDRDQLLVALANVLHNAVKFTSEGGVITFSGTLKPGEVWLSVTDTGIGLQPHSLERIFDQFYQVEDHLTRTHGGLGLGLPTAKAIVERHNGRIWAESEALGQGSTFTLSLPLAYPQ
jgi:signal transduction histidine kinase